MKNYLIAGTLAAALSLSFPAHAQNYDQTKVDPGFYIGGYGGYGWTDADIGSASADVNGADYGLFVGAELDAFLNGWMGLTGAIEGFYGWSEADDELTVAGIPVDVEKENEWGVNFRPGLTFVNQYAPFGVEPYAILGYRRAEFSTSSAVGSTEADFDGFELGIGTELVAYDNIGIRLDYSHIFYEEKSGIDPDEDDLRLGVAYHF